MLRRKVSKAMNKAGKAMFREYIMFIGLAPWQGVLIVKAWAKTYSINDSQAMLELYNQIKDSINYEVHLTCYNRLSGEVTGFTDRYFENLSDAMDYFKEHQISKVFSKMFNPLTFYTSDIIKVSVGIWDKKADRLLLRIPFKKGQYGISDNLLDRLNTSQQERKGA